MKTLYITTILVLFAATLVGQDNSVPFEKSIFKERKDEFKIAVEHMEKADEIYAYGPSVWSQAIDGFEKAQAFNPKNATLNYKLGDCYLYSNYKTKSLKFFQTAYKLNPAIQLDIHFIKF